VGVPNFSGGIEREAASAVAVILDTALGERSASLDVQHVEVGILPKDPEAAGYMELGELPGYIEWHKGRRGTNPGVGD
jgi:hypothetical protein